MINFDTDKNLVKALVFTESRCSINDGEYSVFISQVVGMIGKDDYDLIDEAISEVREDLELPYEGITEVILIETGEREDVFWHKYYQVVSHTQIVIHQQAESADRERHEP